MNEESKWGSCFSFCYAMYLDVLRSVLLNLSYYMSLCSYFRVMTSDFYIEVMFCLSLPLVVNSRDPVLFVFLLLRIVVYKIHLRENVRGNLEWTILQIWTNHIFRSLHGKDLLCIIRKRFDRIGGVIVCVLASSAIYRGFEPRSGQTKDYEIGICCFSAKHTSLRRKSNNWLARNQNNVSEWSDMSIRGLLFQWASTIKIQLGVLVLYTADLIIILLKINLFSPWQFLLH
jgi:hypothetical protein